MLLMKRVMTRKPCDNQRWLQGKRSTKTINCLSQHCDTAHGTFKSKVHTKQLRLSKNNIKQSCEKKKRKKKKRLGN